MNTLRVVPKTRILHDTGSSLDTTDITAIKVSKKLIYFAKLLELTFIKFSPLQTRAGSHDHVPTKPVDISAFSYSKRLDKPDPNSFTKKGEGNGGSMVGFLFIISFHSKLLRFPMLGS